MDSPPDFVAHSKKPWSLINACADDEKVIPIPPSSVDIRVQLTELTSSLEIEVGSTPNREIGPVGGRVLSALSYSAIAVLSGPITVRPSETCARAT